MKTLTIHQTQGPASTGSLPFCTLAVTDLGPMAEATLIWAEAQAQQALKPESFEQWFDSLDEAFAAFDARKAS